MPLVMPQRMMEQSRARSPDDFKQVTWDALGSALDDFKVGGSEVLFATYIEPEVTHGGIIKPGRAVQESIFQGSVGLVLAYGPLAFKYDRCGYKWEGVTAQKNDWIVVRFADCWNVDIVGVSCRVVDHENIRAVIPTPDIITHEQRRKA